MNAKNQIKRTALNKVIDYMFENPEKNIAKVSDMVDKILPASLYPSQRASFRKAVEEQNNWYRLIMRIAHLNPAVRNKLIKTFLVDANFLAWPVQEEMRNTHHCNIPWAILLDPTSACNLHCTGCWAADYGRSLNLSYDEIDSIIKQGVELGTHVYIYTGGEPLMRKTDLMRLCEAHPDCVFLCFTNATLIDETFCQNMLRVGNFIPAISAEGSKETTDSRRGEGTFQSIDHAMDLLKAHGLPFGVSACFTRENADAVGSEEYFDWMIAKGALFCWIFTYMPVGSDAVVDLMPTVEQRLNLYQFVRAMRNVKDLFTLDFQNDGEFVGGCIAGGRRYLHINARGDVEPCVFIHYSNANIRDQSLLDCLKSPIFMEYYRNQPFNDNLLRPCPMLENPECLPGVVERSDATCTNLTSQESAAELCAKCTKFACEWAPAAADMWENKADPCYDRRHDPTKGMAKSDMNKFAELGRAR